MTTSSAAVRGAIPGFPFRVTGHALVVEALEVRAREDPVPTAAEYEEWSAWFGQRADEVAGVAAPLTAAATPDVVVGGKLGLTVDLAVRATVVNAGDLAEHLRVLADTCSERAAICRTYELAIGDYSAQVRRFRELTDGPPATATDRITSRVVEPVRPPRQHSWVELPGAGRPMEWA